MEEKEEKEEKGEGKKGGEERGEGGEEKEVEEDRDEEEGAVTCSLQCKQEADQNSRGKSLYRKKCVKFTSQEPGVCLQEPEGNGF